MFNAHFHSLFSACHDTDAILPHIDVKHNYKLSNVAFSTQELYTLLSRLDVNKAYGSDNFSPHILKQCATQLPPSLANLLTFSLIIGKVPSQ